MSRGGRVRRRVEGWGHRQFCSAAHHESCMSFIVQIWESPPGSAKPTTRLDADALQESLHGKAEAGNERWAAFTQRLLDRYPDAPSDDEDFTSVWMDNSLSPGCTGPLTSLAI